ncbi:MULTISPECIES: hypothetical protein [unclassified Microbacterium]|uniref:hypothetical protein n=1 Tax=unclassified Microbacterium TaxID=2609290 RepID=UPI0030162093
MSLATWVLDQIREALPGEPIFDGPRTARTFDGRTVAPEVQRLVVVHFVGPTHTPVTDSPSKDVARARILIHTFALTRREVDARRSAIVRALKNRMPSDDAYEWSFIEHPVSKWDDPDLALTSPQLHAIDEFTVAGFEK